jgi:hypothetical protein
MVVYCPYEQAQAVTARSRRGPMCSGCGAPIDQARAHRVVEVEVYSRSPARARRGVADGGEASELQPATK